VPFVVSFAAPVRVLLPQERTSHGFSMQVLEGHGHIVAISLEAKDDVLLDRAVKRYLSLLQEQLGPDQKVDDYLLALKVNVSTIDDACEQVDAV
jgi:hypothetical protein